MLLLYILNIAAYPLLLVFIPIYFTRRLRLGWINPLTVVAGMNLPGLLITTLTGPAFLLEGSLFNPYFQYAMLVDNVHSALQQVVLIFLVRLFLSNSRLKRLLERISSQGGQAKPGRMRAAAWIFLALYVIFFVMLAQHSFSVLQWIADPRTGYQLHRTGAGQWYALAITSLSVSIVLATLYGPNPNRTLLLTPIYLVLIYILGSKGLVLFFAEYIVVVLALQHFRHLKPAIIVLGVMAAGLVINNLFSMTGSFGLQDLAEYSNGFTNAAMYYQRYLAGNMPLLHGDILASSFWSLVPRALYPDKPYVYGIMKIVEVFYPGAAENTSTPAFATINFFADFGWSGVIFDALFTPSNWLTGFLYALVLPRLSRFDPKNQEGHSRTLFYAFLLLSAPAFLMFFDFPNNVVLFAAVIIPIDVINRLRFLFSAVPQSGAAFSD